MKRTGIYVLIALFAILSVSNSSVHAQERDSRVQPAFPIGAGEKMLIFTGKQLSGNNTIQSGTNNQHTQTGIGGSGIWLDLPVGTKLKRVLGDFVDQDQVGGADIFISLFRVRISDGTEIILRYFDTSNIISSNSSDFQQAISNPLDHTMLQGWKYGIRYSFPGATASNALIIGVVKVIYEP